MRLIEQRLLRAVLLLTLPLLAVPASGGVIGAIAGDLVGGQSLANPVCTAAECDLIEGVVRNLPFIAFAGDVILLDPDGSVSDVARFFNNVLDTGGGTGLGTAVVVFSRIDVPDFSVGPDLGLPLPSTYSVNAVTILEAPNGRSTDYNGNGTIYHIFSDVPEPATTGLAALGLAAVAGALCKRITMAR
jgi:hypothetical protein